MKLKYYFYLGVMPVLFGCSSANKSSVTVDLFQASTHVLPTTTMKGNVEQEPLFHGPTDFGS